MLTFFLYYRIIDYSIFFHHLPYTTSVFHYHHHYHHYRIQSKSVEHTRQSVTTHTVTQSVVNKLWFRCTVPELSCPSIFPNYIVFCDLLNKWPKGAHWHFAKFKSVQPTDILNFSFGIFPDPFGHYFIFFEFLKIFINLFFIYFFTTHLVTAHTNCVALSNRGTNQEIKSCDINSVLQIPFHHYLPKNFIFASLPPLILSDSHTLSYPPLIVSASLNPALSRLSISSFLSLSSLALSKFLSVSPSFTSLATVLFPFPPFSLTFNNFPNCVP